MPSLVKPHRLKAGEEVGIIAPAGPVIPSELQAGIDLLESLGYKINMAPHVYDTQEYLAGDDDVRLKDFHDMFRNNRVKAVFCARGGYGTLRFLDRIEFDLIRRHPKIIVGYSDVTALLIALYQKAGLLTFHGPMVKEFSKNKDQNLKTLLNLIGSEKRMTFDFTREKSLRSGQATGTLLGGNLSLICHLVGTPYMPSLKGALLFIEERGEPLYRIDRMLTHLRLSHQLDGLSGLIAGTFEGCGDPESIERILLDTVSDRDIPVASGIPLGHGPENMTLPLGLRADLDTEQMTLSLLEPCVI